MRGITNGSNWNSWVSLTIAIHFYKLNNLSIQQQSHTEMNLIILEEAIVFGGGILLLLLFICELGQVHFDYSTFQIEKNSWFSVDFLDIEFD